MKKVIFAIAAAVALIACGGGSSPAGPSGGDDSEFYPLAVGNTWNYHRSGTIVNDSVQIGTITGRVDVQITGTATHSDGFDVYVEQYDVNDTTQIYGQAVVYDSTFVQYLRVTDQGYFGYPHLTDTDSSFTVPFPLQVGNTWNFSEQPPFTGEILSMSESAAVPAGTFTDCMEMQTVWIDSSSGNVVSNTGDFARNVGQVRNVFTDSVGSMVTTLTSTLESYTVQ